MLKMCSKISLIIIATKFYSNVPIQSSRQKFTASQFKFSIQSYALTRSYCSSNPSSVIEKYEKMYENELEEFLKDSKNMELYDKYKLEIEFLKYTSGKIPEKLRASDWLRLLKSNSKSQRSAYLEHRWKIEKKKENRLKKKNVIKEIEQQKSNRDDNIYGLGKCSMFYRIRFQTINQYYNGRLMSAMLHEPTIVFDLGYDQHMISSEQMNCAKQLLIAFSKNRVHKDPFHLYFCNADKKSQVMQSLHRSIPQLYDIDFPLDITSKSYLDVFDKNKLVYLTPHASQIMTKFDPTLVYIIGAIVDKVSPKPLTFQKANREGIQMQKFPLSEMLEWGTGSKKNLPLDQVISILLDLKHTNSWETALKHIPRRKLKSAREDAFIRLIMKREQELELLKNKK